LTAGYEVVEMSGYTPRLVEGACTRALKAGKILVITGARQTGKSTLARHLVEELPKERTVAMNLDDPFLRDRLVSSEGALIAEVERRASRPWRDIDDFYLVLDEVQKAPALFESVKAIHDEFPGRVRFILTGSSALLMHDPVAETLAGRARIVHLHPFTLHEGFCHWQGEDPNRDVLAGTIARLLRGSFDKEDFQGLVERGRAHAGARKAWVTRHLLQPLFPEPCLEERPEEWLRDYLVTYLEKDVSSLGSVGNLDLFRSCVRAVAARLGSTVKWEALASDAGATAVTVKRYVGLLEQTFVALRLRPFTVNPLKRVVRAPKLYLADNGIAWGLRDFEDMALLRASGMIGVYAEQLAAAEMFKWCALEPTAPVLRFWQKTKVSEVDMVISNRGYHIPVEIKVGEEFSTAWLRGLDAFCADHVNLKLRIPYRVVLHLGEPSLPDERTFVLPLWLLA